jgi:hypothetical protein
MDPTPIVGSIFPSAAAIRHTSPKRRSAAAGVITST